MKAFFKGSNILKNSLILLGTIFFIFLGIATFFPDGSFVGTWGQYLGNLNRYLFGYLSFIYPIILTVCTLYFFKKNSFDFRFLEISLAFMLFFIDLLIIQANLVSSNLSGLIGSFIIDSIKDFIGTAGIWLFIVMLAALSFIVFINFELVELIDKLTHIKNNYSFAKKPEDVFFEEKTSHHDKMDIFLDVKNPTPKMIQSIQEAPQEKIEEEAKNEEKNDFHDKTDEFLLKTDEDLPSKTQTNKKHTSEVLSEVEENKKLLETLEQGEAKKPKDFKLPSLDFLANEPKTSSKISESEIDQKISDLLDKLRRFKIDGDVVRTYAGPVVTTFEFRPAPHIKVSKILTLQDDLAMALKAQTIRIQAPVPGKDVVGIEIPNKEIDTIYLKSILENKIFTNSASPLTIALGKDIVGNPFVTDLKKLPHLLIAGTTGSGKSVGINAMLLSLLYRNSPKTLRLLMIDPKMLEFSIYNDIPHLLTPVITQSKEAVSALANMVLEMERRYAVMSQSKTKNIESYNEKAQKEGLPMMPFVVVIIDELADLMMTSGKDVEVYIARLAQMARAAGIHLLVATQRPSVDVVTGLIKANLPSRISFKVGSKIDSKVILDSYGAESLLGRGDMLFTPPSSSSIIRLHAPFASEAEIEKVVEYLKTQGEPDYDKSYLKDPNSSSHDLNSDFDSSEIDELFEDAKRVVLEEQKTSISYLQRRLSIGYNRAANIIEQLEKMGILTAPNSKGQRDIV